MKLVGWQMKLFFLSFRVVDAPMAVTGQDDATKAQWFSIDALPPLAFDHEEIMQDAIDLYVKMG